MDGSSMIVYGMVVFILYTKQAFTYFIFLSHSLSEIRSGQDGDPGEGLVPDIAQALPALRQHVLPRPLQGLLVLPQPPHSGSGLGGNQVCQPQEQTGLTGI